MGCFIWEYNKKIDNIKRIAIDIYSTLTKIAWMTKMNLISNNFISIVEVNLIVLF